MENAPDLLSTALNPRKFEWLSRLGEQIELAHGESLVAKGDVTDPVYILLEGELEASPRAGAPSTFSRRRGDPGPSIGAAALRPVIIEKGRS